MTVYIVEYGEYEQRCIFDVYVSESAAVEGIKAEHPAPYRVAWDPPIRDGEGLRLTGHFEEVDHYSMAHTAHYDISPWEVKG